MKLKSIVISALLFIVALIVSNATATVIGAWLNDHLTYNKESFFWGLSNSEILDGWFLGYLFFVSLIFSLYSRKFKLGLILSVPVLLFYIYTKSFNPQLWLSIIFLVAGIGLSWVILKIKSRV